MKKTERIRIIKAKGAFCQVCGRSTKDGWKTTLTSEESGIYNITDAIRRDYVIIWCPKCM